MVATDSAGGRGSSEEALASSFECARVRQHAAGVSMVGARTRAGEPIRSGNPKCVATHGIPLPRSDGWRPPRGPRRLPAARARHVQSRTTIKTTNGVCCLAARSAHTPPARPILYPPPRAHSAAADSGHTALFSPPPAAPASLSSPPSCHSHSPTNQEREAFNQCHQPGRGFGAEKVSDGCQIFFAGLRPAPQCCTLRAAAQRRVALCARPPNSAACSLIISRWACMLDRARPPKRSPKVAFCIK